MPPSYCEPGFNIPKRVSYCSQISCCFITQELRCEDYVQGRKGPQQGSALGGGLFGQQQKTGLFGQQQQQTGLGSTGFGQKTGTRASDWCDVVVCCDAVVVV